MNFEILSVSKKHFIQDNSMMHSLYPEMPAVFEYDAYVVSYTYDGKSGEIECPKVGSDLASKWGTNDEAGARKYAEYCLASREEDELADAEENLTY